MPRGSRPGERRGGRQRGTPNKVTREVRDLAEKYGPAAVKELATIALDPKLKSPNEATRIAAIRELLDRGFGRPTQALEHSGAIGEYDLTKLSDDEVFRLEEILGRALRDKR